MERKKNRRKATSGEFCEMRCARSRGWVTEREGGGDGIVRWEGGWSVSVDKVSLFIRVETRKHRAGRCGWINGVSPRGVALSRC
mmetsp:Transcript_7661/g.28710  ORF Transcript_7661/g.28710 Transcript_7661/m.28710 type:complete len:84 (-) Transcript_7661:139-390(-)